MVNNYKIIKILYIICKNYPAICYSFCLSCAFWRYLYTFMHYLNASICHYMLPILLYYPAIYRKWEFFYKPAKWRIICHSSCHRLIFAKSFYPAAACIIFTLSNRGCICIFFCLCPFGGRGGGQQDKRH